MKETIIIYPTDTSPEKASTVPGPQATPPYWIAVLIGAALVVIATLTVAVVCRQVSPALLPFKPRPLTV